MTEPFVSTLHGLRLSPLMTIALAVFGLLDVAGAVALGMALLHSDAGEKDVRADWRSPTLAQGVTAPPKAASVDTQTLSRPIFSRTRKPFVAPHKADASSPAPVSAASSAGFSVSALAVYKSGRRAFVISASKPKGEWRDVGDQIDGWTVKEIQSAAVIMQSGAQSVKLMLYPEQTK